MAFIKLCKMLTVDIRTHIQRGLLPITLSRFNYIISNKFGKTITTYLRSPFPCLFPDIQSAISFVSSPHFPFLHCLLGNILH